MKPAAARKWLLVALAGVLVFGFGAIVLRSGPLAAVRVTIATAAVTDLQVAVFGIGTVEARRSYAIGPTAASRVRRVLVDVGDRVRAGQLLAEMEAVDLDDRVVAARAASERAGHSVDAATAQLRDAWARAALAAENERRYEALGRQGFFSASAVESRRQESESAQAALRAAQASLAAAQQDQSRLQAELAAAGKLRGSLLLRAPVDGVVTARDAEPGTTLVAGQSVLRVVDPASLWVRTRIDQARAGGVRAGAIAHIVLRSSARDALPGRVARVELTSDSVTEERLVQVAFERAPAEIALGELAEVTLMAPPATAALAVPNAAVRRVGAQEGVWVLGEGGLSFRPVRIGARALDGLVQVLDGLRAGERVIEHTERELRADDRVRVVDAVQAPR